MKKTFLAAALIITAILAISCSPKGPAGPAGTASASAVFQYGLYPADSYAGSMDAGIVGNAYVTSNYGGDTIAWIGNDSNPARMLVKFDISGIVPSNVKVTGATLYLFVDTITSGVTMNLRAYSVTKGWTEGTYSGTTNVNVSWNYFNGSGNAWTTSGGDFNATPVCDAVSVTTSGMYVALKLNAATVQSWLDTPSSNYGLLIKDAIENGPTHVITILCKENSFSSGPKLEVNYELP